MGEHAQCVEGWTRGVGGGGGGGLKQSYQRGVYVPLKALFLVSHNFAYSLPSYLLVNTSFHFSWSVDGCCFRSVSVEWNGSGHRDGQLYVNNI